MPKTLKFVFLFCIPFFFFLGLKVVVSKNPVYSIFYLVLFFLTGSCLIAMIGFDFLALIFVLVYIGAIAVLFLFVIMILDIKIVNQIKVITKVKFKYLKFGFVVIVGFILFLMVRPIFFSILCLLIQFVSEIYCFFLDAFWPFIDYLTFVNDYILKSWCALDPCFLFFYQEEYNYYLFKVVDGRYFKTNFYYCFLTLVDLTDIGLYFIFFTNWGLSLNKSAIFYRFYKDYRLYEYKKASVVSKKFPGIITKILSTKTKASYLPQKASIVGKAAKKISITANHLSMAAKTKVSGHKFALSVKKVPFLITKVPVLVRRMGAREKAFLVAYKEKTQLTITLKKVSTLLKKASIASQFIKDSFLSKKSSVVATKYLAKKKHFLILSKNFSITAKKAFFIKKKNYDIYVAAKKAVEKAAIAAKEAAEKAAIAAKSKESSASVKKASVALKKSSIVLKKKKIASVIVTNTSFGYYLPNFNLDKPFPLYTISKLPNNNNKYLRVKEEKYLTENFIFTKNKTEPLMDHIFWVDFDSTIKNLQILYTDFSILFLLCGSMLLIAMISCISLTLASYPELKVDQKSFVYPIKKTKIS